MNTTDRARPVSSHTFGTPDTHLAAPQPKRAVSMVRSDDTRPTLIRSQTPVPPAEEQKDIAKMFSSNMFADPPTQKAYGKFGPKLYTDGHERLLFILREECGRMYSFNKNLKDKLAQADRAARAQGETIADLRSINHSRAERVVELTNELRDAQDALQEMDNMLSETRNKRLSRLGARVDLSELQLGAEYAS